jgi:hypothetical protein
MPVTSCAFPGMAPALGQGRETIPASWDGSEQRAGARHTTSRQLGQAWGSLGRNLHPGPQNLTLGLHSAASSMPVNPTWLVEDA